MKYFTILILILALSFFYVLTIKNSDSEPEISKIKLISEIDTSLIAEVPYNDFLKNIDIDVKNSYFTKSNILIDSMEYFAEVLVANEDSLIFEIPKEFKNSDIYVEFNSFSTVNSGSVSIKHDQKLKKVVLEETTFTKHRIFLGKVKSSIVVQQSRSTYIFNFRLLRSVKPRWDRKKKKSIVIFDIAGLKDSLISDTTAFPLLSKIRSRSKYFPKTFLQSLNRYESKVSFLKCLDTYLNLDNFPPYKDEKTIIMDSLRYSSLPEIYDLSGYNTHFYGSRSENDNGIITMFNNSSVFFHDPGSNSHMIKKFYNDINENKNAENFYFLDLNCETDDHNLYLRNIDYFLREYFFYVKTKVNLNDYIFIFISSSSDKIYEPLITMFYSEGNIEPVRITARINLTDVAKTILNYSKLRSPDHFNGNDLSSTSEIESRMSILGSELDTLIFYDEKFIYKKQKYSENFKLETIAEETYIVRKKQDIEHDYKEAVLREYEGDYVKYFIFRNNSEKVKNYNIKINSKSRFVPFNNIEDYYSQKKKRGQYDHTLSVEVKPFTNDTIKLFYRQEDQIFKMKFDTKLRLSYGALSIFAGELKEFYEESGFGRDRTVYNKQEVFQDYDVKIFNRRINF
ncbi:MAG: hypothetical protein JXR69_07575 [Candidatus Delongbacteria bacterium]|nr:hypothetical protein [Candidatus Delongbacteria bacterium]